MTMRNMSGLGPAVASFIRAFKKGYISETEWLANHKSMCFVRKLYQKKARHWSRSNLCRGYRRKEAQHQRALNRDETWRYQYGDPRAGKPRGIFYADGTNTIDHPRVLRGTGRGSAGQPG